MNRPNLLTGALCALFLSTLGCNLLDVTDPENATGRGARAFDPYQSSNSGAIRLSLQMYNGCASMPNGQVVMKNTGVMPGYPETCESPVEIDGQPPRNLPPGKLQIITNTDYFLNQLTVMDVRVNLHNDPTRLGEVVSWLRNESRFKKLDWRNVGQVDDEWLFFEGTPGATQDYWSRRVYFDNANWRNVKDDAFIIEVLDRDGTVKAKERYLRSEFIANTPSAGHSRFAWHLERVLPPAFPGDTSIRPLPVIPGFPPEPPLTRSVARLDFVGSTNPFKTFRIPADLVGDGSIRVTWTQMEDDPFYFPVEFVTAQGAASTCYDANNNEVRCGFGIDPHLKMVAPSGPEGYYKPGDTLDWFVDLRDDQGNRLHKPDELPSGMDVLTDKANGLLYMNIPYYERTTEVDSIPLITFAGPLNKMRTRGNPKVREHYYSPDILPYSIVNETATAPLNTAEITQKWGTRYRSTLPTNVEAGTYVALIKWNRYFAGERVAKIRPYFFQVGTDERSSYPGRVGNCQICHRGVLSLDNLRHGLPVDHVEGCKSCHQYETERGNRIQVFIHKLHVRSPRYPAAKNDCTMCHLTRESTLRPSIDTCSTCHLSMHGDEFFASRFASKAEIVEPNRFGNCAQACHVDAAPKLHIIPEN
ncbi:hypothetical protein [Hyalangium rubrum]|uniref:Uncharacterized protein n=1 Tax=Hyalangium rubrum TaxID=3103134 RepID=A0ABU5H968_9BACT|nr:hypothetical protein [Hyalangium sp. s54d21]MDY7229629.1 hypothetical protein [Hyalangium sp. s54d21]